MMQDFYADAFEIAGRLTAAAGRSETLTVMFRWSKARVIWLRRCA